MRSGRNIIKILCIVCLLQILLTMYLILKVYVSSVMRPDTIKDLEQSDNYETLDYYMAGITVEEPKKEKEPSKKNGKGVSKTERSLLKIESNSNGSHRLKEVEIWAKAAVGSYLWEHIFAGSKSVKIENPSIYTGSIIYHAVNLSYKEGPGLQIRHVSIDFDCLILALNGRIHDKVQESKKWLKHIGNSSLTTKVVVVLLGNEQCKNSWIKEYFYPNGPVWGAFITYDDPMIDELKIFQWPLGVATYRHFPLLSETKIDPDRERRFICNLQATNYVNSSRNDLFQFLKLSPLAKSNCNVKERKEWLASESPVSSKEYVELLLESDLTLCPAGVNTETYRVYEAIEAGSVPVIEDAPSSGSCNQKEGWRILKSFKPPVIWVKNWNELPAILEKEKEMKAEKKSHRRKKLLKWYQWFKARLRDKLMSFVKRLLSS